MRNLKRALSLALASVMLMGMMVVGSSAASYPDVDDQDHVEAIEVLSAVGVIVGDNGNFRPDDSVSRNEMAVIMAKLILGTYEADSYVGNHPFTDVPDWASKYVAACYNSGIIAGRTETTYDGTATVTAVEAAAMMLRALGYEDLSKGAAQWDQPVAAKANEINLFVGLNGAGNAAMNRDSVAQLALNTIQATMVTTVRTGQDITLPDGTVISGTRRYDLRTTNYGWQDAIDDEGNGTYGYLQLGEYLYRGDLKRETDKTDDFGRPATKWLYNSSEIIAAVEEADATYTKEVKVKDIYKDLGLGETKAADHTIDGADAADVTLARTDDTKLGGNGVLIQAFKDKDGNVDIVEINTYLVRATADYNTKDEKLSVMPYGVTLTSSKIANEDVAVSEFAKDDLILVTGVKNEGKLEVKTAELAVLEEDVKVSAYKNNDTVTAGGTKYEYSAHKATGFGEGAAIGSGYNLQKTSYTLYLDKYGYVIGVEKYSDEVTLDDILFVKEADKSGFNWLAKVIFMDGTEETITVAATQGASGSSYESVTGWQDTNNHTSLVTGDGKMGEKQFFEFSKKSSGEYELKAIASSRQGKAAQSGNDSSANIDGGKVQPIINGSSNIRKTATNDTIFITKTDVYTGVKNAPTVKNADVYYLLDSADGNNYILAAYTAKKGVSTVDASEYVYIFTGNGKAQDDKDKTYYTYTAIKDGEKVTDFAAAANGKTNGLYKIEQYEDGYPVLGTALTTHSDDDYDFATNKAQSAFSYKSGTVSVAGMGGYVMADDAQVYVVNVADKSVDVIDPSSVDSASLDEGTYNVCAIHTSSSDSKIAVLWLMKTAAPVQQTVDEKAGDAASVTEITGLAPANTTVTIEGTKKTNEIPSEATGAFAANIVNGLKSGNELMVIALNLPGTDNDKPHAFRVTTSAYKGDGWTNFPYSSDARINMGEGKQYTAGNKKDYTSDRQFAFLAFTGTTVTVEVMLDSTGVTLSGSGGNAAFSGTFTPDYTYTIDLTGVTAAK